MRKKDWDVFWGERMAGVFTFNRLNHAYLFTGSRGTGKTTCAKILAKAVNCLHPVNGNPCGECEICKGIDDGSILDIVEMDAASNRKIDDIRQIIDEVQFKPAKCKYRVYIIDEVHMLTTEAFNALLKTLEEPPEHVIFILATTEVHKLPQTILSRCQRFDFHRIPPRAIADRLLYVANQEGVTLSDSAAMLAASVADGALRDALSLLDRCIAISSEIDEDVVRSDRRKTYLFLLSLVIDYAVRKLKKICLSRKSCGTANNIFINFRADCNASVKKRKSISQRTVSNRCGKHCGTVAQCHALLICNIEQSVCYCTGWDSVKIETLTA